MGQAILSIHGRRRPPCKAIMFGALGLAVAACAEPTGYTETDPVWGQPYGYTDKQIVEDEYSIVVSGNPKTSRERVADIALLRAAHLTEEHGKTHFLILNQVSHELAAYQLDTIPVALGGALVWLPVGERETKEPHALLIIRLLETGTPPPENAHSAAAVIEEVGARLEAGDDD